MIVTVRWGKIKGCGCFLFVLYDREGHIEADLVRVVRTWRDRSVMGRGPFMCGPRAYLVGQKRSLVSV